MNESLSKHGHYVLFIKLGEVLTSILLQILGEMKHIL